LKAVNLCGQCQSINQSINQLISQYFIMRSQSRNALLEIEMSPVCCDQLQSADGEQYKILETTVARSTSCASDSLATYGAIEMCFD